MSSAGPLAARLLTLVVVAMFAGIARAAEPLAVLAIAAPPKVDATTLAFLDEAFASAAAKLLGSTVLDTAALGEKLPAAQLKQASRCDAPKCWRALGEKLAVPALLSSRAIVSTAGLVVSARIVRTSDGRILARAQRTIAIDPAGFGDAARATLDELVPVARTADPTLWPAPVVAPIAVQPIAAATQSVPTQTGPGNVTAPTVETAADIDPSFVYEAPPTPDLATLLGQTRRVDKLWNATWRPGLGFTVASNATSAGGETSNVELTMPAIAYTSGDETGVNIQFAYLAIGPDSSASTPGGTEPERNPAFSMRADFGGHWRGRFDHLSTLFAFGMGMGFYPADEEVGRGRVTDLFIAPKLGFLLHALPGTRGQTLAIGPYAAAELEMTEYANPDPLGENTLLYFVNGEYGLRFVARPSAGEGAARPAFSLEAELFWRRVFRELGEEFKDEPTGKVNSARVAAGVLVGDETTLKLGYEKRLSVTDDLNLASFAMTAAHLFTLSFAAY